MDVGSGRAVCLSVLSQASCPGGQKKTTQNLHFLTFTTCVGSKHSAPPSSAGRGWWCGQGLQEQNAFWVRYRVWRLLILIRACRQQGVSLSWTPSSAGAALLCLLPAALACATLHSGSHSALCLSPGPGRSRPDGAGRDTEAAQHRPRSVD